MLGARRLKTHLVLTARHVGPLGRLIGRLRPPSRPSARTWECEYAKGQWAYLWSLGELPRYSVIAGYVASLKPGGAILDVGCGEGALHRLLKPHCGRYLGIDLAGEAIRRAAQREDATTSFRAVDAASFTTDETFDVIVFNEVLYYFEDPAAILARYGRMLKPEGLFVLSAVSLPESLQLWRALEGSLSVVDEVVVHHSRQGLAWVVQAATPVGQHPPATGASPLR